jgi:hypothetical protein
VVRQVDEGVGEEVFEADALQGLALEQALEQLDAREGECHVAGHLERLLDHAQELHLRGEGGEPVMRGGGAW